MTTAITTPDGIKFVQACSIKGQLRLLSVGMRNSRHSGTAILAAATGITGKTYKRGQYAAAHKDMTEWVEAAIAAKQKAVQS